LGRAESLHQLDVVVRLCSSGVAERVVDPRAGKVDAQRQRRRGSQHTGKQFIYNVLLLKVYWKKTDKR
jgi:Ser-tRNA(Ala) deacylase AlaX